MYFLFPPWAVVVTEFISTYVTNPTLHCYFLFKQIYFKELNNKNIRYYLK